MIQLGSIRKTRVAYYFHPTTITIDSYATVAVNSDAVVNILSVVSYNSLLTGTWVNKHNVWGSDIKAPNYSYPTIFKIFKQQYPQKIIGVFSTWTDNKTKLVGAGLAQTNRLKVNYKADEYELDTVTYPHNKGSHYIHLIDKTVADEAAKCVRDRAPDLSWVYLEYTDDIGHRYGDGLQLDSAVRYMDAQVGRIMNTTNERQQSMEKIAKYLELPIMGEIV